MTTALVLRGTARGAAPIGRVILPSAEIVELGALSGLGKSSTNLLMTGRLKGLPGMDVFNDPTQLLASIAYVIASEWLSKELSWPNFGQGSLAGIFQSPAQPGVPAQPIWNGPAGSYVSMCAEPYQGTAPTPMYANGCGQAWLKAIPNTLPPAEANAAWAQGGVWLGGTFTGDHPPVAAGQDYYWMYGIARPGTSGSTTWDQSYVGGTPGSVPRAAQPGWADDLPSKWRSYADANGIPPVAIPWDHVLGGATPLPRVIRPYWWLAANPAVPVIARPGFPPLVVFPARGDARGIAVPVVTGRPMVRPAPPAAWPVPPGTKPIVPAAGFPPMVRPAPGVAYPVRFNNVSAVRTGPLARASTGTHEVKGQVSQAVWFAMQVKGGVSEFEDLVDAVYKALPASLRKRERERNGKSLSTQDKLRALWKNSDRINLEDAVMNYITTQLDDMIAAGMASGEDQLLRELFPNFEQRMMVRQLIRTYRGDEKAPAPSTNQMYQAAKQWRDAA